MAADAGSLGIRIERAPQQKRISQLAAAYRQVYALTRRSGEEGLRHEADRLRSRPGCPPDAGLGRRSGPAPGLGDSGHSLQRNVRNRWRAGSRRSWDRSERQAQLLR